MAFCGQCGTKSSGGGFCTECGAAVATANGQNQKKSSQRSTTLSAKAEILAELWISYKNDSDYRDFIAYNDLGLPLAYAVAHEIVEMNDQISMFVNETFDVLLSELGIEEDSGFEELGEMFVAARE
jgi:hypothetical protein